MNGATYRIGDSYAPLYVGNAPGCQRGWYDPELMDTLPNAANGSRNDLMLMGMGTNDLVVPGIDSFYRLRRDAWNGSWTPPEAGGAPFLTGNYGRCSTPGHISSPSVVRVPEAASPTGYRYYMAFVGGNADFWQGMVYWAKSNDGVSWSVYSTNANGVWTPIVYGKYGDVCAKHGAGQVQLVLENNIFYIYMQYWHRPQSGQTQGPVTSEAFRMDYNPAYPWGVGPSVRQLWIQSKNNNAGAWVNHSGHLVFTYDTQPAEGTDEKIPLNYPRFGFGAGDVKWNPARQRWLHVYSWGETYWQESTSLANMNAWTDPQLLDMSPLIGAGGRFPNSSRYYPGIWYGSIAGLPAQMWIYVPVDQVPGCGGDWKTMIVPAKLNFS